MAGDPTGGWARPKIARDHSQALTPDQIAALWRVDVGIREKTLWRLLYETAARASEILSLDIADLDRPGKRAPASPQQKLVSKVRNGVKVGVSYDDLDADAMIVCTLEGAVVEGTLAPSSDTAAHAYVYRHRPDVGGVVHTHSTYASVWAARAEPIPCVLTAMADEFGGDIPVGPFAIIGDDAIGRGIVSTLQGHRSRGVDA